MRRVLRVLMTGATGLLGGAVLRFLLDAGHDVRCLIRVGSPNSHRLAPHEAEVVEGDAGSASDIARACSGVDAVVHVAGPGFAPDVVAGTGKAGVDRLVTVSSTSAHSRFESRSGPKLAMERVVRGSGTAWTIVRPTMIFGSELDKNIHRLLRFLSRSPVFPVFGDGRNLWHPVYFEDCARGVCEALVRDVAIGKAYDLPGEYPLSYLELVGTAAEAIGKDVRMAHIPLEPVRRGLLLAERLKLPLPVNSDQVLRIREDKAYSYAAARHDLDYSPRSFGEGVSLEVGRLREVGVLAR